MIARFTRVSLSVGDTKIAFHTHVPTSGTMGTDFLVDMLFTFEPAGLPSYANTSHNVSEEQFPAPSWTFLVRESAPLQILDSANAAKELHV